MGGGQNRQKFEFLAMVVGMSAKGQGFRVSSARVAVFMTELGLANRVACKWIEINPGNMRAYRNGRSDMPAVLYLALCAQALVRAQTTALRKRALDEIHDVSGRMAAENK